MLIGVNRTGGLPELRAVDGAVRAMTRWAAGQGFDPIETITDEGGEEVYARRITRTIGGIVERGDVEQLLVYFSGHGVNLGYSEYWLLSGAPGDPNEAVNVVGSERLARYGPVPHVVFVSDACRTAAVGIGAQAVTGSQIFPNLPAGGRSKPVDVFYAASLGSPALEVADPGESSGRYTAIYTDALVDLLSGGDPELLRGLAGEPGVGVVHPRPLRDRLPAAVLARLRDRGLDLERSQDPDASITSDPDAWLARLDLPLAGRGGADEAELATRSGAAAEEEVFEPEALRGLSREAIGTVLAPGPRAPGPVLHSIEARRLRAPAHRGTLGRPSFSRGDFAAAVTRSSAPYGPDHMETDCGFKLRGAPVAGAFARRVPTELLGDGLVRVGRPGAPPEEPDTVLVRLADGRAALLPAIPGFLATLTFEAGELADVAYEPSAATERWHDYRSHADELRELRSLVAQSIRHGVFRLEGDEALSLAGRIRYAESIDPALAVYAAHAFHGLHREDLVERVVRYLRADLGFLPYDVALLAGELRGESGTGGSEVLPVVPLLAQGWALLGAFGARLPRGLEDLRRHLVPSLWTLFDERGGDLLLDFLHDRR